MDAKSREQIEKRIAAYERFAKVVGELKAQESESLDE